MRAAVFAAAAVALSVGAADDVPEELARQFVSKKADDRLKAIEAVAKLGEDAPDAVARCLVDATADASPKVATAAAAAVAKVRPAIHPLLVTLLIDKADKNRLAAVEELGRMGVKAAPMSGILTAIATGPTPPRRKGPADGVKTQLAAIRIVAGAPMTDDAFSRFAKVAAAGSVGYEPRIEIATAVVAAAGDNEKRVKSAAGVILAMLTDRDNGGRPNPTVIRLARPLIKDSPELRAAVEKLTLSPDKGVRDAATAAIK